MNLNAIERTTRTRHSQGVHAPRAAFAEVEDLHDRVADGYGTGVNAYVSRVAEACRRSDGEVRRSLAQWAREHLLTARRAIA